MFVVPQSYMKRTVKHMIPSCSLNGVRDLLGYLFDLLKTAENLLSVFVDSELSDVPRRFERNDNDNDDDDDDGGGGGSGVGSGGSCPADV